MSGPAPTLTCLGTSDAFGSAGRHCAGYLVASEHSTILLDAGPSVLAALKSLGRDSGEVEAVVLSHLHGDHFAGVPFLFLESTWDNPRTRPLTIVGPPTTEQRVFELFRALYADAGAAALPFAVRFVELPPGGVTEIADLRIEAFAVKHQRVGVSLGHRLRYGGRCITYSGDSEWTTDLQRQAAGADLFLCECTTLDSVVPGHVRYVEIEQSRHHLECAQLLLTHLGREVRARAREIADPLADDGLEVRIGSAPPRRVVTRSAGRAAARR
jgi:ribonuclease BN (tRNA processing enzyme)